MRIEYNRASCAGWFQCVQEWDEFEINGLDRKADLNGSEESEDGVFTRNVPTEMEEMAIEAANSCPVDVIFVYDEDGEQIAP